MNESDRAKPDNESTEALMEQYKLRCQEMLVMVPLYKTHVRNFQIIAGAILGGTAFILSRPDSLPANKNWWLWWAFAAFLPVVTTYLMLDILGTIYTMQIVAEGIARIERQLNRSLGRELFNWELRISEPFFTRLSPIGGVVNPGWFVGAFGIMIYVTMTVGLPGIAYVYILSASAASPLIHALIALSSLVSIGCCAIVAYTSKALNGLRPIVRTWMDLMIAATDSSTGLAIEVGNGVDTEVNSDDHSDKKATAPAEGVALNMKPDGTNGATEIGQEHQNTNNEMKKYRRLEVWFTGVIAAVTLVYAVFAAAQWYETRAANAQAGRALVLTERPWLSLETANYAIPAGKALYVIANMRSTGRSPLVDFHVAADAYLAKPAMAALLHGVTPSFWEPKRNYGPGQAIPLELTFTFPEDIASLVARGASPNISINVRYTDQLGNSYSQALCFYFLTGNHDLKYCGEREADSPKAKP
jgi:hypothetical protein